VGAYKYHFKGRRVQILIVEDDVNNITELRNIVLPNFGNSEVVIAKSRDSSLQLIKDCWFDLIILDRKLPSSDGAFDEDVAHGEAVYSFIKENAPGTLIRFWTAYLHDEYISEKVNLDVRQADVWGNGENIATVGIIPKARFDQITELLNRIRNEERFLNSIEITFRPGVKPPSLSATQKRVLKIFCRQQLGNAIEISVLTGGLSEAKVLRAFVYRGTQRITSAVVKLSVLHQVEEERRKQIHVNNLPPGATTVLLSQVTAGAGNTAATFYRLADEYDHSIFHLLSTNPEYTENVVKKLQSLTSTWANGGRLIPKTIRDLRREYVSDSIFDLVNQSSPELKLAEFEETSVLIQICVQHGDLHGDNVLLNAQDQPILIDYGDVGDHHAAIDPITLELSFIFHPNSHFQQLKWPTCEQVSHWCDLTSYLPDSPISRFISTCRNWAYDVAPGNRSFYAMAYCHLIRQFKYNNTDKAIARTMLAALISAYSQT
jgi:hypothetical protein